MALGSQTLNIFPADVQSLASDLIESDEFQRLKRVSFLGAIERFDQENRRASLTAGSRYEHSLGVTALIIRLQDFFELSAGEFRVALVHALLHDIGHGPFSHSCERFFRSKFGIDHHVVLQILIENERSSISSILRRYIVWADYRRFIRRPDCFPTVNAMFHGPINVDTIEGMMRSSIFFGVDPQTTTDSIVDAVSRTRIALKPLDSFWKLKHRIYNEHILRWQSAKYDDLLCEALFSIEDEVKITDFRLDDCEFEARFHDAIEQQRRTGDAPIRRDASRRRSFNINRAETPKKLEKLHVRYNEIRGINAGQNRD